MRQGSEYQPTNSPEMDAGRIEAGKTAGRESQLQEKLPPEPTKQEQVLDVIKEPGKIQKIWRILKK